MRLLQRFQPGAPLQYHPSLRFNLKIDCGQFLAVSPNLRKSRYGLKLRDFKWSFRTVNL
jgi:hypothetical protein